jgi:hypothetical protein
MEVAVVTVTKVCVLFISSTCIAEQISGPSQQALCKQTFEIRLLNVVTAWPRPIARGAMLGALITLNLNDLVCFLLKKTSLQFIFMYVSGFLYCIIEGCSSHVLPCLSCLTVDIIFSQCEHIFLVLVISISADPSLYQHLPIFRYTNLPFRLILANWPL